MAHLLCFGMGYSAQVLAQCMTASQWTITGTSTTAEGVDQLREQGFNGCLFDGSSGDDALGSALRSATHILSSVPPDARGDPVLRAFAEQIAASPSISWIGYFSTIGVYGDAGGGWVSEDTPATPASERGRRRLRAETAWLDLGQRCGKSVMIFRLPGIYGPGRSAIDDLKAGTARRLIKPGQVFNRIHVADIAAAVAAAIERPQRQRVFNVTDDEPGPPQDVVAYAADLLGLPVPPDLEFATADLSPMARSFYSESKRVSNARMKSELGVSLLYPTYREGLLGILRHGGRV